MRSRSPFPDTLSPMVTLGSLVPIASPRPGLHRQAGHPHAAQVPQQGLQPAPERRRVRPPSGPAIPFRQYIIPYCSDMKAMEKPEVKQKYIEGPVGVLNLMRRECPR